MTALKCLILSVACVVGAGIANAGEKTVDWVELTIELGRMILDAKHPDGMILIVR